ncbi:MAG: Gfo/Idh/MocA family oxidoreductase [Chloroflexota bacterium]
MYRIGIVGCGRISHQHLKACQALEPRAKIVAACEMDRALLDKTCDEFNIGLRFQNVADLAASSEVDVVIVITPPHVRLSIAKPLLEGGKHLLIEKPFAESIDEARAIVELGERLNRKVAVNQNYRWYDGALSMRQQILDGKIGTPSYAIINDCGWRDEVSGWRKDTTRLALAVMGVHWLDRFRWLLNDEPIAVSSITASRPTLASQGENETTSIIEFRSGAMATLIHSWSSHSRGITNFQQFDGSLGSLILHGETDVMLRSSAGDETEKFEYNFTRSFGESLTRLLDAVENDTEPPHSARDNLMTMALLEACYQSAAEKRRVEIALEGVHS